MIQIIPIAEIPEIRRGDDLAALLSRPFAAGDVLVVTQKIISKAEGLFVDLATIVPGEEAISLAKVTRKDPRLVELVLQESTAIVRAVPHVLITRHYSGCVMANAGIDQSNVGEGAAERVLLLPRYPDTLAEQIHKKLNVAVVVSDSFGRPWRMGVTNVAIGAAGLPALVDRRGSLDRDGRPMEVTQIALADQIAAAAGLAMGEGGEGIPAAIVRGLNWNAPDAPAAALIRPLAEDLFQ